MNFLCLFINFGPEGGRSRKHTHTNLRWMCFEIFFGSRLLPSVSKFLKKRKKLLTYTSFTELSKFRNNWKCNWKWPGQYVGWSVGRLVGRLVDWLVCHNFLKGRGVTLPCSNRSTCLLVVTYLSILCPIIILWFFGFIIIYLISQSCLCQRH